MLYKQRGMENNGILYGDDSGFESEVANGYDEIEAFSEAMREANQVYVIATLDNKEV